MYSVIKNVYGSFVIEESGMPKKEAINLCSDVIGASHGGEAYVVDDETANALENESCTEHDPFTAYGLDGKTFEQ